MSASNSASAVMSRVHVESVEGQRIVIPAYIAILRMSVRFHFSFLFSYSHIPDTFCPK
jgi:hypothetical protein